MTKPAKQLKGRAARLSRLMPSGPAQAARTPFVLLVVLLLGGGLITLLLLNSSLNEGSFKLSELKKRTTELTDKEQELQQYVDDRSAPGALERRARELGMVPGGSPAFLNPDGSVRGVPSRASAGAAPARTAPLSFPVPGPFAPPAPSAAYPPVSVPPVPPVPPAPSAAPPAVPAPSVPTQFASPPASPPASAPGPVGPPAAVPVP
ncbi:septum formation initiator family protein [Streptomyces sp. ISL-100]|uniref:septum formation initiator family protein n=1 Tax=Streptomyces sp. ISL-100 TaxID=2819173 RepID=UPI001BE916E4|nr:septum formation initiator family protein [Streptomyces sp. ISL-100]MBT2399930.1 septum formation initiator family protein [Streptomyces sp. ISL-100]